MKLMISEFKEGQTIDTTLSVKYKRGVTPYQNGWKLTLGTGDKTGEIEVTFWGENNEQLLRTIYDSFQEGDVIRVQGTVGTWKERKKIDVNLGKGNIQKTQSYDLEDFLPTSEKNIEQMYAEMLEIINNVKHDGLRKLLKEFFENDPAFIAQFKKSPGAMFLHHAWIGGLLEHSLTVAKTSLYAASLQQNLDLDLVLTGALLHDIGKTRELTTTTNIKVSEEGMLRGHLIIGEELVRQKALQTDLDTQTALKLSHMLLSHHGLEENGAPKKPMFSEAIIVYYADEMDAKASQFARIKKETTTEDFRVYDKNLGQIYLK